MVKNEDIQLNTTVIYTMFTHDYTGADLLNNLLLSIHRRHQRNQAGILH